MSVSMREMLEAGVHFGHQTTVLESRHGASYFWSS